MIKLCVSSKARFREEGFTEEHQPGNHLWLSKSLKQKLLETRRLLREVSASARPVLTFSPSEGLGQECLQSQQEAVPMFYVLDMMLCRKSTSDSK